MKSILSTAAFALGASAAILRPRASSCFGIDVSGGHQSGSVGQLSDGQNRVGPGFGGACFCLSGTTITDATGKGCVIAMPQTQFQCDEGKAGTPGFSITSGGVLAFNGSTTFYECAATAESQFNLYTTEGGVYCSKVTLTTTTGKCAISTAPYANSTTSAVNYPTSYATSVVRSSSAVPSTVTIISSAIPSTVTIVSSAVPSTVTVVSSAVPSTVTLPGSVSIVTQPAASQPPAGTVTLPGTVNTVTQPAASQPPVGTVTIGGVCSAATITSIQTVAVTAPGQTVVETVSVTAPGATVVQTVTVTAPGQTIVETVSVTAPGATVVQTVTVTAPGQTIVQTVSVPAPAIVQTVSVTGPGKTVVETAIVSVTSPGKTVVETAIVSVTGPGKTMVETVSVTGPGKTVIESATVSVTGPGKTIVESATVSVTGPGKTVVESATVSVTGPGKTVVESATVSVTGPGKTVVQISTAVSIATTTPSSTPATSTTSTSSACVPNLSGAYQTPHLIVPVNASAPTTAYGTQYFGNVSPTVSSIFNFDIPASHQGNTCTLIFLLPLKSQLETADYTTTGSGSVEVLQLSSAATEKTTYNTVPGVAANLGTFALTPGSSTVIASGSCAAGETVTYELKATGSYSLNWFEDWNPSPLGLFIAEC